LALIVTVASTAFAQQGSDHQQGSDDQQGSGDQQDQVSSPISPVPMPFGDDKSGSTTQEAKTDLESAELLLMGYHGLPPKEAFEENLDQPKVVLTSIVLDDDGFLLRRKRALAALGYWADAGVLRLYTRLLQDPQAPEALHHAAILSIADHFPDEALGHLEPYLTHDDLQYRLSAIEAIRRLPGEDAIDALREALKTETNAVAKKRLEKFTRVLR
jgi:hypothetical protein